MNSVGSITVRSRLNCFVWLGLVAVTVFVAEAQPKQFGVATQEDIYKEGWIDSDATIGESKSRTSLDLTGHQNALVQALVKTGKRRVEPGVFQIMIGSTSADIRLNGSFEVLGK